MFKYCSGTLNVRHHADVAVVVERHLPADVTPKAVLSSMETVQALAHDLLGRLHAVEAAAVACEAAAAMSALAASMPAPAQTPVPFAGDEGDVEVDVVGGVDGEGSVALTGAGHTSDGLELVGSSDSGSGSSSSSGSAGASCDSVEDVDVVDVPRVVNRRTQVPVLPRGGGSCARLSLGALPFLRALVNIVDGAVTAGRTIVDASDVAMASPTPFLGDLSTSRCAGQAAAMGSGLSSVSSSHDDMYVA